ncbi:hypothetical protein, partial [Streptococcus pseudopneumoniae]|uniref:hypothetical protein n=1 Tax=Streptococcus pseudopneumoniae TaxID=257758 RepID=UPI0018B01BFF
MRDVTDRAALETAIGDLARGCELAGPELRARVAKALIAKCVIRPGVLAADLTSDAPTAALVDGSSCWTVRPVPVRLGTIRV